MDNLFKVVYKYKSIWNESGSKEFSSSLILVTKGFLTKYQHRIEDQLVKFRPILADLNAKVSDLKTRLADLKDQMKNITKRISEFESPIGKIVEGFDDLVLVFPLAMPGGFSVCSSFLIQTIRYRKYYLRSYPRAQTKQDGTNILRPIPDDEMATTAPLWIDKK